MRSPRLNHPRSTIEIREHHEVARHLAHRKDDEVPLLAGAGLRHVMQPREAFDMLAPSGLHALGPGTWADLGCGDGTFTLALAEVLSAGSTIHAMDQDLSALKHIPSEHHAVRIDAHLGDFTTRPWPFHSLHGILLANSLHFVRDQRSCIQHCETEMRSPRRFLIVEYDTSEVTRWVPFPIGRGALATLFGTAGYRSIRTLGSRPSVHRGMSIYAVFVQSD